MRKNLQQERKNNDFTQVQLARLLNISDRHYQDLEAGNSKGSVTVWEKLGDLFNKPIDYLLENTKEPKED